MRIVMAVILLTTALFFASIFLEKLSDIEQRTKPTLELNMCMEESIYGPN